MTFVNKKTNTHRNRGFSLVETLVAISILLVSIVAPLTIASKSLQNSYFASEQYTASMLAQEGVEAVINLQRRGILWSSVNRANDGWAWYRSLSGDCKGSYGCAMDFANSSGNPVTVHNGDCASSDCRLYFNDGDDVRIRYTHDSSLPETPYYRAIRVIDVGGPSYEQAEVESRVYWDSAAFPGTQQEVIVRSFITNIATSTI